jgi:hypothetical protein
METLEWKGNRQKRVAEFIYLGALVSEENEVSADISAQIASGNGCFHAFITLLKSSPLPRKLKLTVYCAIIRSVVLYGCETWTLTECVTRNGFECESRRSFARFLA